MCKSTSLGPVQAETAKVDIHEDNSSSFINVHLPSMTYVGAAVLMIIALVVIWRWLSHRRQKTAHKQRIRELELSALSRSTQDINASAVMSRGNVDNGDTVRVAMMPTARTFKALDPPAF